MSDEIGGWATTEDGRRIPISRDVADEIMRQIDESLAKSAADMPTTDDAVRTMNRARERMKALGWRDGTYCPKDGAEFAVIEYGSTGIFTGFYSGEWPTGHVIMGDCVTNPKGIMWKAIADLTEAEEAARQKSAASTSAFIERLGRLAEEADDDGDL